MADGDKPASREPDEARDLIFKKELVQLIPHLRAFARTLTGDPTAADDLAQDAMMKAWDARASFQLGTNMKAWTFMILRNQFYSEKRRSWRQSQLDQEAGVAAGQQPHPGSPPTKAATRMPASSRPRRTATAIDTAPSLSPCTQTVSARSSTTAPSTERTVPVSTSWRTRSRTSPASCSTAPGRLRGTSAPVAS